MAKQIDEIEQAMLLQCFRELRSRFGFASTEDAAKYLGGSDPRLVKGARDVLNRKAISRVAQEAISRNAMKAIGKNFKLCQDHYQGRNLAVARFLSEVLTRHDELNLIELQTSPSPFQSTNKPFLDHIIANLRKPIRKGNGAIQTGLYQIFRRYKPPVALMKTWGAMDYDWKNPCNHVVICELIYVDSDRMEAIIITAERHRYYGSLFINHEEVMFGLFQRITQSNGVNKRFLSLRTEGRRLPMYSGLSIKVGDTTRRPLAVECIFVRIPPAHHGELYEEVKEIFSQGWTNEFLAPVEKTSIVLKYLSDIPPLDPYQPNAPTWARVKFIRDFPGLTELASPNSDGIVYFREPIRTNSADEIAGISHTIKLPILSDNGE